LFDHPPYSPDLASSDYHLFTYLKNWLWSQRFNINEKLMECVKTWLNSQAADFFGTGIQKPTPRYDKCCNACGDCVGKCFKYVHICYVIIYFLIARFVNSSPEVTFWIALVYEKILTDFENVARYNLNGLWRIPFTMLVEML
jgi:hypothetical protein